MILLSVWNNNTLCFLQTLRSPSKLVGRSDSLPQVDARYPAILFKQQLTACVEKIFGQLRDNLKKEISPLLTVCIQVYNCFLNLVTRTALDNLDLLVTLWLHAGSKVNTWTSRKNIQVTWGWCPTGIKFQLGQHCQFPWLAYGYIAWKSCKPYYSPALRKYWSFANFIKEALIAFNALFKWI